LRTPSVRSGSGPTVCRHLHRIAEPGQKLGLQHQGALDTINRRGDLTVVGVELAAGVLPAAVPPEAPGHRVAGFSEPRQVGFGVALLGALLVEHCGKLVGFGPLENGLQSTKHQASWFEIGGTLARL